MMWRRYKFLLIILFLYLIVMLCFQSYHSKNYGSHMLDSSVKIPVYNKFISANFPYCGGLGNQLFHFTTLYGIGRSINRTPFFSAKQSCSLKEIKHIFPNLYKHTMLLNATKNETKYIHIVDDCCDYKNFSNANEKYLIFKEIVPFRHRFFAKYRNEILHLLEFNQDLKKEVKELTQKLLKSDESHKFCIHIRRGDFMKSTYKYQESRADFIQLAIAQIHAFLTNKNHTNISLIFFGQDDKFKHSLNFSTSLFNNIYYPAFPSRDHDMALGALHCDTFLISATASTFAWWIAYLMPEENRNIFYNGNSLKKGRIQEHQHQRYIPSKWMRLDFNLTYSK